MSRLRFDPDAFMHTPALRSAARAPVRATVSEWEPSLTVVPGINASDYADLPGDLADGLRRMNALDAPRGVSAARWEQLVLDAHRLAWSWGNDASKRGWSILQLWGIDPDLPEERVAGLLFSIRGRRVVSLFADPQGREAAAIITDAGYLIRYPAPCADTFQPIWALRVLV